MNIHWFKDKGHDYAWSIGMTLEDETYTDSASIRTSRLSSSSFEGFVLILSTCQ